MIWHRIILSNLIEAHGDLMDLQARMVYLATGKAPDGWKRLIEWDVQKKQITPGILAVQMQHIYHHVNWAWNCKNADEARAVRCEWRDYRRWEKFPKDWPELWLPPSRCRKRFSKWRSSGYRWKLDHPTAMRIAIDEAEYTLGLLCVCVAMRLGGDEQKRWGKSKRFAKCASPCTENDFADMMRHLYMKLNEAWNSRNLNLAGNIPCSRQYFRCLFCFPRAFPELWPKTVPTRRGRL